MQNARLRQQCEPIRMSSTEKTSWRWQLEQLQQQLGEWIEVKLRSNDRDLQLDIFPPWLGALLQHFPVKCSTVMVDK